MNNKKLLANKRRVLCHELGHAIYFIKFIAPVYYNKIIKTDKGVILERNSTIDIILSKDHFLGKYNNTGFLFRKEELPINEDILYSMAGFAMENIIYSFGFAKLIQFDEITRLEEYSDAWLIREKAGKSSPYLEDLFRTATDMLFPFGNRVYKQARLITSDIKKINEPIHLEEIDILKILGLSRPE